MKICVLICILQDATFHTTYLDHFLLHSEPKHHEPPWKLSRKVLNSGYRSNIDETFHFHLFFYTFSFSLHHQSNIEETLQFDRFLYIYCLYVFKIHLAVSSSFICLYYNLAVIWFEFYLKLLKRLTLYNTPFKTFWRVMTKSIILISMETTRKNIRKDCQGCSKAGYKFHFSSNNSSTKKSMQCVWLFKRTTTHDQSRYIYPYMIVSRNEQGSLPCGNLSVCLCVHTYTMCTIEGPAQLWIGTAKKGESLCVCVCWMGVSVCEWVGEMHICMIEPARVWVHDFPPRLNELQLWKATLLLLPQPSLQLKPITV